MATSFYNTFLVVFATTFAVKCFTAKKIIILILIIIIIIIVII